MNKEKDIVSKIGFLLKDKPFLKWLNSTNQEDKSLLEEELKIKHPENNIIADAEQVAKGFHFKKVESSDQQVHDSWDAFTQKLEMNSNSSKRRIHPIRRRLIRIAAAILLLVIGAWGFQTYFSTAKMIVEKTDFGETKTITLPDGSSIILNTNSSITYRSDFLKQKNRSVKLEGEAYFEVTKQPSETSFIVQMPDVDIKVIGTAFNCNSKRSRSIISLSQGNIQLIKDKNTQQHLIAGQTAWLSKDKKQFQIIQHQTNYWTSWITQEWAFGEGIAMSEVLQRIQETFGLSYEVKDVSILKKKASGDVSIESKEVLFEALSILLDVEIVQKNNQIILTHRE